MAEFAAPAIPAATPLAGREREQIAPREALATHTRRRIAGLIERNVAAFIAAHAAIVACLY